MRICYLINYAGAGGSEKYVKLVEQAAAESGHATTYMYNQDGPLTQHMKAKGVPTCHLKMSSPLDIFAAYRLARACKSGKVDIVHVQFPRENCVALLARLFYPKLKVVYTCHLLYQPTPVWTLLNKLFTRGNARVIAVCKAVSHLLVKGGINEKKVTVIYNGITPGVPQAKETNIREKHGVKQGDFLCVLLGRYTEEKGIPFLIDTFAQLKGKAKCIILGEGPGFQAATEQIARLGLEGQVIQAGYCTNGLEYLRESDLSLNTSSSEAFSFAILEGMGAGLPTVATNVGGNSEMLTQFAPCGKIIEYGDIQGLAGAILSFKEDRELCRQYGVNAAANINERFHLNKMLQDTIKIYEVKE